MKQIPFEDFKNKLQSEEICFINTFEDAAIRSVINDDELAYYVKFRGKDEFLTQHDSKLVTDAVLEHTTLTREEYDNFK